MDVGSADNAGAIFGRPTFVAFSTPSQWDIESSKPEESGGNAE